MRGSARLITAGIGLLLFGNACTTAETSQKELAATAADRLLTP